MIIPILNWWVLVWLKIQSIEQTLADFVSQLVWLLNLVVAIVGHNPPA